MTEKIHQEGQDNDSQSPGHQFSVIFQSMQDAFEKLSILNYYHEFCQEYKTKPIHRYYFCISTNPGEQFFTFACLCAWLIKSKAQIKTDSSLNPQEYEDPNSTISTIYESVRSQTEEKIDFSPSKLKSGFGREVIWVLNILLDVAIEREKKNLTGTFVTVKGLTVTTDEEIEREDDDEDEDELETNFDEPLIDEDDDDKMTDPSSLFPSSSSSTVPPPAQILMSAVDESSWWKEVERILPQLKVVIRSNNLKSDWRLRLSHLHSSRSGIQTEMDSVKDGVNRLVKEISSNMDKISSREKHLQSNFDPLLYEYLSLKSQLDGLESEYEGASSGVTSKSQVMSDISDELEAIKQEMEERGSAMTDGSPLVSLRKGLARLKSEVTTIDVRIGVATHTILQNYLKDSVIQVNQMRRQSLDSSLHLF